jgi:hypothetical protein
MCLPAARRSLLPTLALVVFALFLTSPELLHAHGASGLGLYNADCPFAEVSARHGEASLAQAPTVAAGWLPVGLAEATVVAHVPARLARSADPRAPPLA